MGEGSYGRVHAAKRNVPLDLMNLVAMKVFEEKDDDDDDDDDDSFRPSFVAECAWLVRLRGPGIVRAIEIENGVSLRLAMEHWPVDLAQFARYEHPIHEPMIRTIALNVIKAVRRIHEAGCVHCDLKPDNILVNPTTGDVAIADFGISRRFEASASSHLCTLWYRPPELILGCSELNPSVDMWCVGAIIARLFRETPLFMSDCGFHQLMLAFQITGTPDESQWPGVAKMPHYSANFPKFSPRPPSEFVPLAPPLAQDLILKLLAPDPKQRPSASEAEQHPYFTKDYDILGKLPSFENPQALNENKKMEML